MDEEHLKRRVDDAIAAWLGEVEGFSLRAERCPVDALPWVREAALVGARAVLPPAPSDASR